MARDRQTENEQVMLVILISFGAGVEYSPEDFFDDPRTETVVHPRGAVASGVWLSASVETPFLTMCELKCFSPADPEETVTFYVTIYPARIRSLIWGIKSDLRSTRECFGRRMR